MSYKRLKEREALKLEAAKDRYTLLFCANIPVTFKYKSMLAYRSETPRSTEGKNVICLFFGNQMKLLSHETQFRQMIPQDVYS